MNVAILGTGGVGRTLAEKIDSLGHEVVIGTRDVDDCLTRSGDDPFAAWHTGHAGIGLATFAAAAAKGEIVFNATAGTASLDALRSAGAEHLAGKILIDIANPLDFSAGMPPTLTVSNTDSLAEQIQRAFSETRVVKALNTVTASVMVDPGSVGGGDHHIFIAGDDAAAKTDVTRILTEWFGWRHVVDAGGVAAARGLEMYLPLWVTLMMTQGTPFFNIRIVT